MPNQREVQIYPSRRGLLKRKQWRARLMSGNGSDVLFSTPESYNNRTELEELCRDVFPSARLTYPKGKTL